MIIRYDKGRFALYREGNKLHYILTTKDGVITQDYDLDEIRSEYWHYEPNCTHAAMSSMDHQCSETFKYHIERNCWPKRSKNIERITKDEYESLFLNAEPAVWTYKDSQGYHFNLQYKQWRYKK